MKRTTIWIFAVLAMAIAAVPLVAALDRTSTTMERATERASIEDPEQLREMLPDSFEAAEKALEDNATASHRPVRRFLMWTHNGEHIMWGRVGHSHFIGTDDMGNHAWGIYGKQVFAGFYEGEFFFGKYRGGNWKAEGLFGEESSRGRYVLFPAKVVRPHPTPRPIPVPEPDPAVAGPVH